MATVLELAREVRHRLNTKDTGCLYVEFTGDNAVIQLSDGAIRTGRAAFLACFTRNPIDFRFKSMAVPNTGTPGEGILLLNDAIEAIEDQVLARSWDSHKNWRVAYPRDSSIHNTFVREYFGANSMQLRRLTRLVVSGSATLEAPNTLIADEIREIELAFETQSWHEVLGLQKSAEATEIKRAYRKRARRFHPDRWISSPDAKLRDRAEKTFKIIGQAYVELSQSQPAKPQRLIGPKPKLAFLRKLFG
jgi:DnaJ-domain-containing protein 1